MLQPDFSTVPACFHAHLSQAWQRLQECPQAEAIAAALATAESARQQQLWRVLVGSDYVLEQWLKRPQWLLARLEGQPALASEDYARRLQEVLVTVTDEAELMRQLRLFRHERMQELIWLDLNRLQPMPLLTLALSRLADCCTQQALDWLYPRLAERWGTPYGRYSQQPQQLVVLGMGKLGANELNLSSDIDLIFAYAEKGETQGGRKSVSNEEFFAKLGQNLIKVLDHSTAEGFVFRVDMRLRPYGSAGTLVPSFGAMESYYQEQGRDWERYAMIKARVMAGDQQAGSQLLDMLRPFVYRRYLDYSAFESLRGMKQMINREVRRKGLEDNVKLGQGGIREVEFIAQAFQLIRGGRDQRLQARELLRVLPQLPDSVGMPASAVAELLAAYEFLRNTEHGIQALRDEQSQLLPASEFDRQRLAWSQCLQDWPSFMQQLEQHRVRVRAHFNEVISDPEDEQPRQEQAQVQQWLSLWEQSDEVYDDSACQWLAEQGFQDSERVRLAIDKLRTSRAHQVMQAIGQERLQALVPLLLAQVGKAKEPEQTLERVLQLVEAVLRRTAYLVLLVENPSALEQLVRLSAESAWFATHLARYPVLLDELIDVQSLYRAPDRHRLAMELHQLLLRTPEQDVEQLMEALRYFKNAQSLRVAAADITGVLPLMKVSDALTFVAEVILQKVLEVAWQQLVDKHGRPLRGDGEPCERDFIIVGYGKLGGIELSYGSDLDLVFIHDADPNGDTEGPERVIPNQTFFTRLGQKIIHLLTTFTPSGQLYEVDMRLRPSGASGLLVSSLQAFVSYQHEQAWTWEQQALVRARVVAGSERLGQAFEQARVAALARPREREVLRQEVVQMRQKMRDNLGSAAAKAEGEANFHLKQDAGGIVDIEFLVQFLALAHAHQYPQLVQYSDNIRILEAAEQLGLLTVEQAESLREAYKAYRAVGHRLTLQNRSGVVTDGQLDALRTQVSQLWQELVEGQGESGAS